MTDVRGNRRQKQADGFQSFLQQCAILVTCLRCLLQYVHQGHHRSNGSVEFVMLANILAGLADRQMDRTTHGFLFIAERIDVQGSGSAAGAVLMCQAPYPAQESVCAFHASVRPFQAHIRR